MTQAVVSFLNTLSAEQKPIAVLAFDSEWRFDWNYTPRERKGLPLKQMNEPQRKAAMKLVELVLSQKGVAQMQEIIGLEYVLRELEKRPPNDTRRDPENYAFAVFGDPNTKQPWGWSVEGHHLSLHFSVVNGKIALTPSFFGTNPGIVPPQYQQAGKQVLKAEADVAFRLLHSFSSQQLGQVLVSDKAPADMLTANSAHAKLDKQEGLRLGDMTPAQQQIMKELIGVYVDKYHVTLKNQQLQALEKAGMNDIRFVWMGDQTPEMGEGKGHYYRLHGTTLLIEYDNTQNNANHVHSVVRDLTNDFGEDLLKQHYEKAHSKK